MAIVTYAASQDRKTYGTYVKDMLFNVTRTYTSLKRWSVSTNINFEYVAKITRSLNESAKLHLHDVESECQLFIVQKSVLIPPLSQDWSPLINPIKSGQNPYEVHLHGYCCCYNSINR